MFLIRSRTLLQRIVCCDTEAEYFTLLAPLFLQFEESQRIDSLLAKQCSSGVTLLLLPFLLFLLNEEFGSKVVELLLHVTAVLLLVHQLHWLFLS